MDTREDVFEDSMSVSCHHKPTFIAAREYDMCCQGAIIAKAVKKTITGTRIPCRMQMIFVALGLKTVPTAKYSFKGD